MNNISLTASMRSNLNALQNTNGLLSQTQERLSTGRKVNSALDNPSSYFSSVALTSRANDFATLQDAMSQSIQTVKAADAGIKAITALIESAKSIANSALAIEIGTTNARDEYRLQYNEILAQINTLARDSSYEGVNLINSDNLTTVFNEDGSSSITISGVDYTSQGLSIQSANPTWPSMNNDQITSSINDLDAALITIRAGSARLSSNLNIIKTRQTFTKDLINNLENGADNLTLADRNQEAANMLALQTQQSLSINSLSLASQANQSVLQLFR